MLRLVVCPACAHNMCSACTGNGCYCDCQLDEYIDNTVEAIGELDDEERFQRDGYC